MSACTTSLTGDGAALVGALGRGHAVSNLVMRSFESCLHDPRHGYKFRNSKFRFDSIRFDAIRFDSNRKRPWFYTVLRQTVPVALPQGDKSSKMHATKPERQPQFLETSRLESARSLHTERTHSRAKETAETACNA